MKKRALIILLLLLLMAGLLTARNVIGLRQYRQAYERLQQESSFVCAMRKVSCTSDPATGEETAGESLSEYQVVKTDSGYNGIGHTSVSGTVREDADTYNGDLYIRDGLTFYAAHEPAVSGYDHLSFRREPDYAFALATAGILELSPRLIAGLKTENTAEGRLLSFTINPKRGRSWAFTGWYHPPSFNAFREPPLYTVLLDDEGRLKSVHYSFCLVGPEDEPGLYQQEGWVDFLSYGDVELDFSELHEEDYTDFYSLLGPSPEEKARKFIVYLLLPDAELQQAILDSVTVLGADPPTEEERAARRESAARLEELLHMRFDGLVSPELYDRSAPRSGMLTYWQTLLAYSGAKVAVNECSFTEEDGRLLFEAAVHYYKGEAEGDLPLRGYVSFNEDGKVDDYQLYEEEDSITGWLKRQETTVMNEMIDEMTEGQ